MIYKSTCSCAETYTGENIRNASIISEERNNPTKKSEPAKHLTNNFDHVINWVNLSKTLQNCKGRHNLEASYIT